MSYRTERFLFAAAALVLAMTVAMSRGGPQEAARAQVATTRQASEQTVASGQAQVTDPAPKVGGLSDRAQMFESLDTNHDDLIDPGESARIPKLSRMFGSADTNHDGSLDKPEFIQALAQLELQKTQIRQRWHVTTHDVHYVVAGGVSSVRAGHDLGSHSPDATPSALSA